MEYVPGEGEGRVRVKLYMKVNPLSIKIYSLDCLTCIVTYFAG